MKESNVSNPELVWAKSFTDTDEEVYWLPLWMHLQDALGVSKLLWQYWVPSSIKSFITTDLGLSKHEAEALLMFLSGLHDLGKATPDFSGRKNVIYQTESLYTRMCSNGFSYKDLQLRGRGSFNPNTGITSDIQAIRHEVAGAFLIKQMLVGSQLFVESSDRKQLRKDAAVMNTLLSIVAGHHGSPKNVSTIIQNSKQLAILDDNWMNVCSETYEYVMSLIPDISPIITKVISNGITQRAQILLTSLVIMSDWLASSSEFFPLIPMNHTPKMGTGYANRLTSAWDEIRPLLPSMFVGENNNPFIQPNILFERRFNSVGVTLRPIQKELLQLVSDPSTDPHDIFIVEAPMGDGKTEAALLAAEILMHRTKSNGFFMGLPTMATGEAMYTRVEQYLTNLLEESGQKATLSLNHSKSYLSSAYSDNTKKARLNSSTHGLIDEGWLHGSKMRLLNSFSVGTVDNFLMLSLKVKYNYWRHLGLASKVIIIDEVHAADDYMMEYLKRSLQWAGFYQRPVILLSATLTAELRTALIEEYKQGKKLGNEIV
jgi:CRISPR-associated endonuclease/helicase Cas3